MAATPDSFLIGGDTLREMLRVLRKVEGMAFRGNVDFTNGPTGISGFVKGSVGGDEADFPREWFWAKITGHLAAGDNRWQYSYTEQQRTSTGFSDLTDGRTGTTDTRFAINSIEANNAATGIQGNSIDHDDADYPAGFELLPVQGNPVVQIWAGSDENGDATYTFSYVNGEQGSCA